MSNPPPNDEERIPRVSQPVRDMIVLLLVTAAATAIFVFADVHEALTAFLTQLEHYELDECLLGAVVLCICLCWFSVRRWRASNRTWTSFRSPSPCRDWPRRFGRCSIAEDADAGTAPRTASRERGCQRDRPI